MESITIDVIQNEEEKEKYANFIEQAGKLYDACFEDNDEKENFRSEILPRIASSYTFPKTEIHVAYNENNEVVGAAIYDIYNSEETIHLIYIFVAEKYRRKSIGTILIRQGRQTYHDKTIFFELDKENMDALKFYEQHNARILLEHYIQPPLNKDLDYCENMYLCHLGAKPSDHDIWKFLICLYQSANALETPEGREKLNIIGKMLGEKPLFVNE